MRNINIDFKAFGRFIISDRFLNTAIRIMLGLICLLVSLINAVSEIPALLLAIAALLICGYPVFKNAVTDLKNRSFLSENVLITIAGIAALAIGNAADGVVVLLFADLGLKARDRFYKSKWSMVENLTEAAPEVSFAKVDNGNGIININTLEKFYTPVVLLLAVITAVIASIFADETLKEWIYRAFVLFVAACPCAVSAVCSLTYYSGICAAAKKGIIFKTVSSVDSTAMLTSIVFNKTGTIKCGQYTISGIYPVRVSSDQLLYLAAYVEAYSSHPLAKAICEYSKVVVDKNRILKHHEEKGIGCIIQLDTSEIISAGNLELMERLGVRGDIIPGSTTSVYVAVGKTYVGRIDFEDSTKDGAKDTVDSLRRLGVANVALITGDNTLTATKIGREVGISEIYADCLPKDKYERLQYIVNSQEPDDKLGLVCGADSEISAMELADVGIILGAQDTENSQADVVITSDSLSLLPVTVSRAKEIVKIARQNLMILFAIKLILIILSLCGILDMWAVLAIDIAAMFITVINSMRTVKD